MLVYLRSCKSFGWVSAAEEPEILKAFLSKQEPLGLKSEAIVEVSDVSVTKESAQSSIQHDAHFVNDGRMIKQGML